MPRPVNPLVFPLTVFALVARDHPGNDQAIRDAARRIGKKWPQFRPFVRMVWKAEHPGKIIDEFFKNWEV